MTETRTTKKGLDVIRHVYPHPTDLVRNLETQLNDRPRTDAFVALILDHHEYSGVFDEQGILHLVERA